MGTIQRLTYRVDEAAGLLGVSRATFYRMVARGELRAFMWGGCRLVRADALLEYIERRDNPAPAPAPTPVKPAESPPAVSGVYLLYQGDRLSYVGRSGNIRQRIREHRWSGRAFDEVRVIACEQDAARWLEAELIRVLQPVENIKRFERRARLAERAQQAAVGP